MRILFITDSQAKSKSPARRTDIFSMTILRKFLEISNIAPLLKVDAIVHGGDMFDIPRVSPDFVGQMVEIIKMSECPWYVVPGNHDLYGHTVSTVNQTMLGLIAKSGVVTLLTRENPQRLYDSKNGFSISLQGQEYYAAIDQGNPMDYDVVTDPGCAYHLLAVHGMLLDKPFNLGVTHTLISDIQTSADMILVGHYHPGYAPQTIGKTTVINPGSMARVEASAGDNRIPQYVIIDIDNNGIRYALRPFRTAKPAAEVLDFKGKQVSQSKLATLVQFKSLLSNVSAPKALDMVTVLNDIASDPNNGIDPKLVADSLAYMGQVQVSKDDSVPKLDGFVETQQRVWITRIEAKNFQSHKDLDIELAPGLNVIRGESNSGKTSIMRIIRWVQSGEPKGSDMISNWAKGVWGKITYSNGYSIERERTKKDSGTVKIYDPTGAEVGNFKGVKDNPVDIINVHQMPPIWIAKDEKRNIAYADQLETSFLVTESAGLRAAAIGRLTGLQNVDASIRTLNSETKALNKEIGIKEQLIDADVKKLANYNDIQEMQTQISELELLIQGAKQLEVDVKLLQDLEKGLTTTQIDLNTALAALDYYSDIPTVDEFDKLESIHGYINMLTTLRNDYTTVINDIASIQTELSKLKHDDNVDEDFENAENLMNLVHDLIHIEYELDDIKAEIALDESMICILKPALDAESMFDKAEKILKDTESIQVIANEVSQVDNEIAYTEHSIDECLKEIAQLDEDASNMFHGGACECPTCGQLVSRETITGGV